MKLKIRLTKITITFVITMLFVGLLFFSLFINFFTSFPWGFWQYFAIAMWLIGAIVFYLLTINFNYYVLQKKYFVVKRYNKEQIFYFSEIVYIDEHQSEKSKTICFVTNKGHVRYLTFDKEGVLYEMMKAKCVNRLDEETFKTNYPKIKI